PGRSGGTGRAGRTGWPDRAGGKLTRLEVGPQERAVLDLVGRDGVRLQLGVADARFRERDADRGHARATEGDEERQRREHRPGRRTADEACLGHNPLLIGSDGPSTIRRDLLAAPTSETRRTWSPGSAR